MSTFDVTLIAGSICGIVMVVGGILLLYKGSVTLTEATKEAAVSVEFQKLIKITTRYPALGLFVIGLAFVTLAATLASPPSINPLRLNGTIRVPQAQDVTINVTAGPWSTRASSNGEINETIIPHLRDLHIEIVAPGYERKFIKTIDLSKSRTRVDIGDITESVFGNRKGKPEFDPVEVERPLPPSLR